MIGWDGRIGKKSLPRYLILALFYETNIKCINTSRKQSRINYKSPNCEKIHVQLDFKGR